jgi:hypothetical protein
MDNRDYRNNLVGLAHVLLVELSDSWASKSCSDERQKLQIETESF